MQRPFRIIPAMTTKGGLGEGVGCGMMGLAGGWGAETRLQPSSSINYLCGGDLSWSSGGAFALSVGDFTEMVF